MECKLLSRFFVAFHMHASRRFRSREIPVIAIQTPAINHSLDGAIGTFNVGHIGEAAFETKLGLQKPHDFKLSACQFITCLA